MLLLLSAVVMALRSGQLGEGLIPRTIALRLPLDATRFTPSEFNPSLNRRIAAFRADISLAKAAAFSFRLLLNCRSLLRPLIRQPRLN